MSFVCVVFYLIFLFFSVQFVKDIGFIFSLNSFNCWEIELTNEIGRHACKIFSCYKISWNVCARSTAFWYSLISSSLFLIFTFEGMEKTHLVDFFLSIIFQFIIVLYTFTVNIFRWWAKLWMVFFGNKIKLLNCTNVVILQMGAKNALNYFLQISVYLFCRLNDFEKKCWSCTC